MISNIKIIPHPIPSFDKEQNRITASLLLVKHHTVHTGNCAKHLCPGWWCQLSLPLQCLHVVKRKTYLEALLLTLYS